MVTYVTRISNITFCENFLHARFININYRLSTCLVIIFVHENKSPTKLYIICNIRPQAKA